MVRASVSTEVNEARKGLSHAVNTVDSDTPLAAVDLGELIELALKRAGISHKQACAYMNNLDRGQWSKQLKGQDNHQVSLQRLFLLPHPFWFEFMALLGGPLQMKVSSPDLAELTLMRVIALMEEVGRSALQLRDLGRTA